MTTTYTPLHPTAAGISPQGLPADQANILEGLAQTCFDSAEGFRQASEEITDQPLTKLFRELSDERALFADELNRLATYKGGDAAGETRSLAATAHQWWMAVRAKIARDDVFAVLQEAERGEDVIKAKYEDALERLPTGSALHKRVHEQYEQVRSGHDRVRDLRDLQKKKSK